MCLRSCRDLRDTDLFFPIIAQFWYVQWRPSEGRDCHWAEKTSNFAWFHFFARYMTPDVTHDCMSASALPAQVRILSDSACVEGALWQRSQFTRSEAQLHYKGEALCVTLYGSMQGKDPLGAFGLRNSKARASRPGFPFCLCLTQLRVQIRGLKLNQPTFTGNIINAANAWIPIVESFPERFSNLEKRSCIHKRVIDKY